MEKCCQIKKEAEEDYLQRRYDVAREEMEQALQLTERAMEEAERARNAALAWIYLSEWMATTAAALTSGIILWWIMVRRRLYREVSTTPLRRV